MQMRDQNLLLPFSRMVTSLLDRSIEMIMFKSNLFATCGSKFLQFIVHLCPGGFCLDLGTAISHKNSNHKYVHLLPWNHSLDLLYSPFLIVSPFGFLFYVVFSLPCLSSLPAHLSGLAYPSSDRLVGQVVKASDKKAEGPEFESRLRRDFSGSSHTSDLKIGAPVAAPPGAWRYRVSTGTGRSGVSIL